MQEDVDHMETHRVKASGQVVVNPATNGDCSQWMHKGHTTDITKVIRSAQPRSVKKLNKK